MDITGVQLALLLCMAFSAAISSLLALRAVQRAQKSRQAARIALLARPYLTNAWVKVPETMARADEGACRIAASRAPPELKSRLIDPERPRQM